MPDFVTLDREFKKHALIVKNEEEMTVDNAPTKYLPGFEDETDHTGKRTITKKQDTPNTDPLGDAYLTGAGIANNASLLLDKTANKIWLFDYRASRKAGTIVKDERWWWIPKDEDGNKVIATSISGVDGGSGFGEIVIATTEPKLRKYSIVGAPDPNFGGYSSDLAGEASSITIYGGILHIVYTDGSYEKRVDSIHATGTVMKGGIPTSASAPMGEDGYKILLSEKTDGKFWIYDCLLNADGESRILGTELPGESVLVPRLGAEYGHSIRFLKFDSSMKSIKAYRDGRTHTGRWAILTSNKLLCEYPTTCDLRYNSILGNPWHGFPSGGAEKVMMKAGSSATGLEDAYNECMACAEFEAPFASPFNLFHGIHWYWEIENPEPPPDFFIDQIAIWEVARYAISAYSFASLESNPDHVVAKYRMWHARVSRPDEQGWSEIAYMESGSDTIVLDTTVAASRFGQILQSDDGIETGIELYSGNAADYPRYSAWTVNSEKAVVGEACTPEDFVALKIRKEDFTVEISLGDESFDDVWIRPETIRIWTDPNLYTTSVVMPSWIYRKSFTTRMDELSLEVFEWDASSDANLEAFIGDDDPWCQTLSVRFDFPLCSGPLVDNLHLIWKDKTPPFVLTTEAVPEEGGTVEADPAGPHEYGASVIVSALPADGYAFDGWEGDLTGTTNPATIEVKDYMHIKARFVPV